MQRTLITAALVAASAAALAMPGGHGSGPSAQHPAGCGGGMTGHQAGQGPSHDGRMASMHAMRSQMMQERVSHMHGQHGQAAGPDGHRHGQQAMPAPQTTP